MSLELKCIKQGPNKVFRSFEGKRKVWLMFLKATGDEKGTGKTLALRN